MDRDPFSIHPVLEAHIRKQSEEENYLLEESILAEGCRDPLVVWEEENVLVDGHHRLAICRRHGIPYSVVYRSFSGIEAAKAWMDLNQLGRRNLSKEDRDELIRRLAAAGHRKIDIAHAVGLSPQAISKITSDYTKCSENPIKSTSAAEEIAALQEKVRLLENLRQGHREHDDEMHDEIEELQRRLIEAERKEPRIVEVVKTPPDVQARLDAMELELKGARDRLKAMDEQITKAREAGKDYESLVRKKLELHKSVEDLLQKNNLAEEERKWALVVVNSAREIRETLNRHKGVIEDAARKGVPAWANANAIRECAERCYEIGDLLSRVTDVVDVPTGEEGGYERHRIG